MLLTVAMAAGLHLCRLQLQDMAASFVLNLSADLWFGAARSLNFENYTDYKCVRLIIFKVYSTKFVKQ